MLGVSALLCLGVAVCYHLRPDALAALTVFPVWGWFGLGMVLMGLGWRRGHVAVRWVGALWVFFLLGLAEEPRSLARTLWPVAAVEKGRGVRVVSLNCSAGDPLAAAEVAQWKPDVVLLQESPSRSDVEKLTRRLFGEEGGFVWGVDGSIVARGEVTERVLSPYLAGTFVQAGVRLPSGDGLGKGREIEVLSLRLITPPFRFDWWSGAGRKAYRAHRELQREQMNGVRARLLDIEPERAVVLGGDFNAPQGDAIFEVLRPRLRDSFARAGRGWGNTIINEFAVLRIDQIWASTQLQPREVRAYRTQNSDHRAVVADFGWSGK